MPTNKIVPGKKAQHELWSWANEKDFINNLGKRITRPDKDLPDRRVSNFSRLDLLQMYLYLCENVRDKWDRQIYQYKVCLYIKQSIEKEMEKVGNEL